MRPSSSLPLSHRLGRFVMILTLFTTVVFLIAPIALTVVASFAAGRTGVLPSDFVTFESWRAVLELADIIGSQRNMGWNPLFRLLLGGKTLMVLVPAELAFGIGLALGGALINLIVGVPIAYAVARYKFPSRERVNAVSVLPLVPSIVLGVAFLRTYPDLSAASSGLIVGCSLLKAPFMVMAAQSESESMPLRQLGELARSLGASWPRTFLTIIVPNARSGTVSEAIICWAPAAAEFNFLYIVWANGIQPLALFLQRHISSSSFIKATTAVSMFFFIIVAITLLLQRVGRRGFDIRDN